MSAPIHRLSGFAETCGFVNQSLEPFHCGPPALHPFELHASRHPFSQSYGANLPSSSTKVLPFALVFSTRLPVSVCGTGAQASSFRDFSRQPGLATSASRARVRVSAQGADFPTPLSTYPLSPTPPIVGWLTCLRPPITRPERFRNVDRMSITYAFRPRLRPD